jgi:hypothetical protein
MLSYLEIESEVSHLTMADIKENFLLIDVDKLHLSDATRGNFSISKMTLKIYSKYRSQFVLIK